MRRRIIVANWKMNGDSFMVDEWLQILADELPEFVDFQIVVCPPMVYLDFMDDLIDDLEIEVQLGAQNVSEYSDGAYTGEVSATMIREFDCDYVIVGHSERRRLYGETNKVVAKKAKMVLENYMKPIACVGETLEERESGQTRTIVEQQLEAIIHEVNDSEINDIMFAYEPVWAIGTGRNATPEQAQEVHGWIRQYLAQVDADTAEQVRIVYGGSVNPDNAKVIFEQPDVDGGLVGGASLDAEKFLEICMS